jgi:predicted GH43/DUF377 family glycosyl hydrolase
MNTKRPQLYSLLIIALGLVEFRPSLAAETELPKWALGPFVRPETGNPVIKPDASVLFDCPMQKRPVRWEALHTFNPAAVARDGRIFVIYRAEDDTGEMRIGHHTSRIGLAESADGIQFTKQAKPVLFPDTDSQIQGEWSGGCEDPRVVEGDNGVYVMTYNQWNRKERRLAIATSVDLVHWQKHGPAFTRALNGKYASLKSESGAIVCELDGDRLKAVKIQGKYWMYWGLGVISLAYSDNLLDWTIVEDNRGEPVSLIQGRAGHFDSSMVEVGPPALLTEKGVIVFYNGQNLGQEGLIKGDPELGNGAYAGGQALFDSKALTQLIGRTNSPFIKPELAHEKTGQYAGGATFIEGLVYVNGKWFLYYSCADSKVGVAIYDLAAP